MLFRFIPIKTNIRDFGERLENGSRSGLSGILQRDEAQAMMRSAFYRDRLDLVDYTAPFWKSTFHLYVRPEWLFSNTWIFTLFSWQSWYYTVFLIIILSCFGYFLQKIPTDKPKHKRKGSANFNLGDHFFYTFTIMSARGDPPEAFYNKFKILSISKSIFAWLILSAFSSNLIYRMTNRELILPFHDIDSLINNTKYVLLMFRGTLLYKTIKQTHKAWIRNDSSSRIEFMEFSEDMHNKICNNMQKYVLYEIEDKYMVMKRNGCPLRAMNNYYETWIAVMLQKNFHYRKTFNYALLKFREVGLLDGVRDRWFNTKVENPNRKLFKMIDFNQVYLIFLLLYFGILISFMILILEKITYYYKVKNTRQHGRK
ncbi:glutamate receptor 1 [Monomorium pharaonis]|uniref:glutamate receptor 1 n=1 Tax=Monomorium pharaonis TaxID=307658 RepID=UPI0017467C78|nr:glutamate receptor 1 [Monomorium pharaonis]